jgi:hypothetical protein
MTQSVALGWYDDAPLALEVRAAEGDSFEGRQAGV